MVAGYRARASRDPDGLIDDPWAEALAGQEGEELAENFDRFLPHMGLWVAVRTAYLDERVRYLTGAACGHRQVVVLGAGLDTRAARLGLSGVRFFEVDHPATQAGKRERIARVDGYPVDAATYVSCDFERESFLDRLGALGFDATAPSVIVWEGVTPYLTEEAVRATLGRIAKGCAPRTVVLFDFIGRKIVEGRVRDEGDLAARDEVQSYGEPLVWGTNDVLPLAYECGMRRISVRSFDELALDLTGTYERERKWRFQYMAETSVAKPERGL
jgi:methyltransferase (TIGR00027 family)